jgi:H+-transporting ATPase
MVFILLKYLPQVEGTIEFTGANTFFGKTASLLGGTSELSNFQMLLVKIVTILVFISCVLCLIVLIYLAIETTFVEALSYAVVLMVSSIVLKLLHLL